MNFPPPLSLTSCRLIVGLVLLLGLTLNVSFSDAAALPEIFYTTVIEPPVYVTVTSCTLGTTDVVVGTVIVTETISPISAVANVATDTQVVPVTTTINEVATSTLLTTVQPTTTDFVVATVTTDNGMTSPTSQVSSTTSTSTFTSTIDSTSISSSSSTTSSSSSTSTIASTSIISSSSTASSSSYTSTIDSTSTISSSSTTSIEVSSTSTTAVASTYPAEVSPTAANDVTVSSSATAAPTYESSSVGSVSGSLAYLAPSSSYSSTVTLPTSSDSVGLSSSTTPSEPSSPTITTIPSGYASSTATSSQVTTSTTTTIYTTVTITITWSWTTISTDLETATPSSVYITPTSESSTETAAIQSTTSMPISASATAAADSSSPLLSTSTTTSSISSSTSSGIATSVVEVATSTSTSAIRGPSSASSTPLSTIIPYALTYSPYTDSSDCKSGDEVAADLAIIAAKGISTVRIYGTDCNSLNTVESAAATYSLRLIQGLWIDATGVDSIDSGLSQLISWGSTNSNWDMIAMITVGNEAVQDGFVTVSDLMTKISSVRTQLRNAGYMGPITTAETPNVFISNPELCTSDLLDLVAINAQPYFDEHATAETAGEFDLGQIQLTQAACNGKDVFITETGYPSSGIKNFNNVPSVENQQIAIQSILEATNGNVTMFTMYNDLWKPLGPYQVEQSFGIIQLLS
ncbi:glycoside hydrolase superfamily [Lipomyces kononenkoae]|uniref:Glycoside hydrolase superfamily n=1 Tax=Lipomyces kononenkoae TaxID=34357 RepID=A0ACC3TAW0_LIPKO